MFLWQRASGDGTKTEYQTWKGYYLYPFFVVQLAAVDFSIYGVFLYHFLKWKEVYRMSVFRVEKNKGYTVMNNHHLRNRVLTLKAKRLLP